ncbi:quinone oxidoreductase-like protein 2 [Mesocricetus auratus]|uniref:Quinone oxidoreductase-like protein 2 n=1 Tax=Mesocricetus auratus TaxID=10036 RepID=A0A1U8BQW0_MESAU|nr:quinone oxidoreductase-like protein 2 [Mesocricetus auratus]
MITDNYDSNAELDYMKTKLCPASINSGKEQGGAASPWRGQRSSARWVAVSPGARPRPPFRSLPGLFLPRAGHAPRNILLVLAARLCARHLPLAWFCRRASQGQGRHYRAALCAELKHPLIIEEVASRPVGPHEVRVDVHFCGVNFADILVCRGQYQEKPTLPFIPGMEFSGTVLETGTDVSTVKKGDRVIGVSNLNAMAEECITDQKTLWRIPENVSLQDAAVLPVSYGTAILAVEHRARTQPGETVLVTAAAGATGLAVIDVATNVLQAKVIAAAGSDEKCKLAVQRGAQSSVNYSQGSLKEAVKKLVGSSGVNVAIDMVGGDVFLESVRSLAWEGRIVVLGFAGGNIASLPSNLLLLKNISAMGLYWGRYQHQDFALFSKSLSSALQYCQQGLIHPHTGAVFKLEKINDAFLHVIQRKSTGKVLLSLK